MLNFNVDIIDDVILPKRMWDENTVTIDFLLVIEINLEANVTDQYQEDNKVRINTKKNTLYNSLPNYFNKDHITSQKMLAETNKSKDRKIEITSTPVTPINNHFLTDHVTKAKWYTAVPIEIDKNHDNTVTNNTVLT